MARRWPAALLLPLLLLAGCGPNGLFPTYDAPESADVATAPWPRLVDTPPVPPVGSPEIPDPARGAAIAAELGQEARAAALRARALGEPVLTESDLRQLGLR